MASVSIVFTQITLFPSWIYHSSIPTRTELQILNLEFLYLGYEFWSSLVVYQCFQLPLWFLPVLCFSLVLTLSLSSIHKEVNPAIRNLVSNDLCLLLFTAKYLPRDIERQHRPFQFRHAIEINLSFHMEGKLKGTKKQTQEGYHPNWDCVFLRSRDCLSVSIISLDINMCFVSHGASYKWDINTLIYNKHFQVTGFIVHQCHCNFFCFILCF